MRSYHVWEVVLMVASVVFVLGYHLWRWQSNISLFQKFVSPVWAAIHQQRKSTSTITAIQNLRNVITMCTMFATLTLGVVIICARLGSSADIAAEMLVVTSIWAFSFVNFCIAANSTHYLLFNISLYPEDKTDPAVIPIEVVHRGWRRSDNHLTMIVRHVSFGERSFLIAVAATFISMGSVAFVLATMCCLGFRYYVDKRFGLQVGNVKVDEAVTFGFGSKP